MPACHTFIVWTAGTINRAGAFGFFVGPVKVQFIWLFALPFGFLPVCSVAVAALCLCCTGDYNATFYTQLLRGFVEGAYAGDPTVKRLPCALQVRCLATAHSHTAVGRTQAPLPHLAPQRPPLPLTCIQYVQQSPTSQSWLVLWIDEALNRIRT